MRYGKSEGVGSFHFFSGEQHFKLCISFANVQSNSLHFRSTYCFASDSLVLATDNIPKDSDSDLDFLFFANWTVLHCTFVMGYGGDTVRQNA
jgi:hypothetical protein